MGWQCLSFCYVWFSENILPEWVFTSALASVFCLRAAVWLTVAGGPGITDGYLRDGFE